MALSFNRAPCLHSTSNTQAFVKLLLYYTAYIYIWAALLHRIWLADPEGVSVKAYSFEGRSPF
jgi:hypothetical protein